MPIVFQAWQSAGVKALPGYFIADTPWAGWKSTTGFARSQASTAIAGGYVNSTTPLNDLFTDDHYLATGTFNVAMIALKDTNLGIASVTGINGTQSFDWYAGAASSNNYSEVTGIAVTASEKTVQVQGATKNASSSNYYLNIQTIAYVRTAP